MKMPFGKHRGLELEEVPEDYLAWCLDNLDLKPTLRQAIKICLGLDSGADGDGSEQLASLWHKLVSAETEIAALKRALASSGTAGANGFANIWKARYRRLAMLCHPDRGGSQEAMALLNEINDEVNGK